MKYKYCPGCGLPFDYQRAIPVHFWMDDEGVVWHHDCWTDPDRIAQYAPNGDKLEEPK